METVSHPIPEEILYGLISFYATINTSHDEVVTSLWCGQLLHPITDFPLMQPGSSLHSYLLLLLQLLFTMAWIFKRGHFSHYQEF